MTHWLILIIRSEWYLNISRHLWSLRLMRLTRPVRASTMMQPRPHQSIEYEYSPLLTTSGAYPIRIYSMHLSKTAHEVFWRSHKRVGSVDGDLRLAITSHSYTASPTTSPEWRLRLTREIGYREPCGFTSVAKVFGQSEIS